MSDRPESEPVVPSSGTEAEGAPVSTPEPTPAYTGGEEHAGMPLPTSPRPYETPAEHRSPRGVRRVSTTRLFAAALVGGIVGALLVGGAAYLWLRPSGAAPATTGPVTVATSTALPQPLEAASAKVLPSVVNVAIETPVASGVGSGIIIRADGYILTNNHVVTDATRVTVRIGTTDYPAKVVGADPASDLAVIKISKTGLPAATLGDSSSLQVGETVIAIGSPFGLDKTVTSGIVSALHRSNLTASGTGVTAYTNLIQTDASINPGNSGGALADLSGEVVGINALIETPTGQLGASQSAGIGFAIPIDFARAVADQIVAGKKVTHPFLGVSPVTVTPSFAQQNGLSVTAGALIQQVSANSPAAAAGIQVGDIVVTFGGAPIISSDDLFAAVRSAQIGTPISVELVRNGSKMTVQVTLAAR